MPPGPPPPSRLPQLDVRLASKGSGRLAIFSRLRDMPLCLWQKYAPCPEAEILRFEEARGIRLPSLLRNFLLVHDGAEANDLESIIYTKDPNCPLGDLLPARIFGMQAHNEGAST